MMKMKCALFFPAIATILFVAACKRDEPVTPQPQAGKGGNATLKVIPKHHGNVVDSCTVYIKYNTQDAATNYDDSVKCIPDNGISTATFSGLKTGNYYLYGKGWDEDISMEVIGGLPYTITEETTLSINLPVTEGD
jgi:hypothetical protein